MDRVRSQFLAGVSLQKINLEEVLPEFTDYHQQLIFLKSTLLHPAVLLHPLNWKYQNAFLRKCIYLLECMFDDDSNSKPSFICVRPEFYKLRKQFYTSEPLAWDETFEHYALPNSKDVISAVYDHHRYSDENELCSVSYLQVKLFLADWMTSNKERFKGKRLLDLGSGNGAAALIVSKMCAPKEIILSNIEHREITMAERNIKENGCGDTARVLRSIWNPDHVYEQLERDNVDPQVVMAVDEATVGEDLHRKLLDLVLILGNHQKSFHIYLASVQHSAAKCSLSILANELRLQVDKVGSSKDIENNFYWDDRKEMNVYLIQRMKRKRTHDDSSSDSGSDSYSD